MDEECDLSLINGLRLSVDERAMPFRAHAILVVLGCVLAGCGGKDSSPTTPTPPSGSPAPTTIRIPGATPLTTTAYVPNPVAVQVGATVTWINHDNVSHTSTSNVNAWNSGDMPPGSQFSFTFQSAGAFNYLCLIHPNMIGTITISNICAHPRYDWSAAES